MRRLCTTTAALHSLVEQYYRLINIFVELRAIVAIFNKNFERLVEQHPRDPAGVTFFLIDEAVQEVADVVLLALVVSYAVQLCSLEREEGVAGRSSHRRAWRFLHHRRLSLHLLLVHHLRRHLLLHLRVLLLLLSSDRHLGWTSLVSLHVLHWLLLSLLVRMPIARTPLLLLVLLVLVGLRINLLLLIEGLLLRPRVLLPHIRLAWHSSRTVLLIEQIAKRMLTLLLLLVVSRSSFDCLVVLDGKGHVPGVVESHLRQGLLRVLFLPESYHRLTFGDQGAVCCLELFQRGSFHLAELSAHFDELFLGDVAGEASNEQIPEVRVAYHVFVLTLEEVLLHRVVLDRQHVIRLA